MVDEVAYLGGQLEQLNANLKDHTAAMRDLAAAFRSAPRGGSPSSNGGGKSQAPAPGGLTPYTRDEINRQGEYGDPVIRKAPPRWDGPDVAGLSLSSLPSDVLRQLAESMVGLGAWHDSKGNVDAKNRPKGDYSRMDARRALYWADHNEGRVQSMPERDDAPPNIDDQDIPF